MPSSTWIGVLSLQHMPVTFKWLSLNCGRGAFLWYFQQFLPSAAAFSAHIHISHQDETRMHILSSSSLVSLEGTRGHKPGRSHVHSKNSQLIPHGVFRDLCSTIIALQKTVQDSTSNMPTGSQSIFIPPSRPVAQGKSSPLGYVRKSQTWTNLTF